MDAPVSQDMVYSDEVLRGRVLNATNEAFRCYKRGEIANAPGTACLCDIGFEMREGESDCAECQDGYYKPSPGMTPCLPCVSMIGYPEIADEEKMKTLTTGGTGATNADACVCRIDNYHTDDVECQACPAGTNCTVPGVWLPEVAALPGYWRSDVDSPWFYQCPIVDHCLGGTNPAEFCVNGSLSVQCNTCAESHGMSSAGCTKCGEYIIVSLQL